ncbi:MAG: hypothetical protein HUU55_20415, partial [Myxococcales bacterium]|nr:hypothetical protein [Myxococcales bacterium]
MNMTPGTHPTLEPKRRHSIAVFMMLFLLGAPTPATAICLSPPGDVTASGVTNVTDVQCMILGALAELSQAPYPVCAAVQILDTFDQDCNLSINVADILIVIALSLQQPLGTLDGDQDGCVDACLEPEIPTDPLAALSDEFDDASSVDSWTFRHVFEADPPLHTTFDIDTTLPGSMVIDPNNYDDPRFADTATGPGWFQDRHGPYAYKTVTGDFAVEVSVHIGTVQNPDQLPLGHFNSAGVVLRDPSSYNPQTPNAVGFESWIMYNVGYQAGFVGAETKTTFAASFYGGGESRSTLFLTPIAAPTARLVACRIGSHFHFFRSMNNGQTWTQETHSPANVWYNGAGLPGNNLEIGFERPDLPATLQV